MSNQYDNTESEHGTSAAADGYVFESLLKDHMGGARPAQSVGYFLNKSDAIDAVKGKRDMGLNERGVVIRIKTGPGGKKSQVWPEKNT
jgi:hypothetical protein